MAIFTGHNHLITVRHGNAGALGKLREQLEASPTQFGKGVDYVLHAILHRVVDQYLPIFEMIEDDVLAMERRSLHDFLGPEEVARIFELRSELTRFQRTLGAMAELVRKLVRGHFPCISAEMTPYFHDVADHVHRVQSMVDGLLLVLSTVFEASSLLEAQRIGVVTRQLAAWAAILAVPTAIAGIYGMNFKHMPELDTIWLLRRARSDSGVLPSPIHALQEGQVAMSNALRELLRPPSHSALCARACPIQFKMKVLP
jgi:magnesium transporter